MTLSMEFVQQASNPAVLLVVQLLQAAANLSQLDPSGLIMLQEKVTRA